ncbi:spermidine/putrescine ABC transporter permease [Thermus scotoductus]|uniref:Spermidine/putrescine ABC transporter permease n=1 Tax=Thermus scotoductus TaxID=37636 RepID=A0A430SDE5_THESC|nr:ABC transporter permease [Thermus scotoductus]RTG96574.1 spermidine/putrescine ABC transporter permease [Thermus scotoductus]RTH11279.1 spermidine/putrescine ABC transporter permease [Thermus scotoductus]RTH12776.1 spermidine/putrescine ABC transporter permease [Thermus scotoductus]RTH13805.1 spermidine/putrescine ABC transporter permease [Thermus scotoductus]RTH19635.1 spermidine/putrescine ABC transporter permease [Thermus scotoductus]
MERPGWLLRMMAYGALLFLHFPVLVVILYAFTTEDRTYHFPPPGLTLKWFGVAFAREDMWAALGLSFRVALVSTVVALGLSLFLALGMRFFRFALQDSLSLLVTLPIALPGIVTGIALLTTFRRLGVELGFWTIVAGHVTFTVVVVYNAAVARLRRLPDSWIEASLDLGANLLQTFRHVLLPPLVPALLSGAMLAFALSLDEVIVTTFTAGQEKTLPIWLFSELFRPRERPLTNVVAVLVMGITLVPLVVSQWLAYRDEGRA